MSDRARALLCSSCGGALPISSSSPVTCPFCGTTHTSETALGDLLLGADLRGPTMPGWQMFQPGRFSFGAADSQPELRMTLDPTPPELALIGSAGLFEDVDVSVRFRFPKALPRAVPGPDPGCGHFVLYVRGTVQGGYRICVAHSGMCKVAVLLPDGSGPVILDWCQHPAVTIRPDTYTTIRCVVRSTRLEVWFNGVFATVGDASRFPDGRVFIGLSAAAEPIEVAVSELTVRQPAPARTCSGG